jgi:hypothetical protein
VGVQEFRWNVDPEDGGSKKLFTGQHGIISQKNLICCENLMSDIMNRILVIWWASNIYRILFVECFGNKNYQKLRILLL